MVILHYFVHVILLSIGLSRSFIILVTNVLPSTLICRYPLFYLFTFFFVFE